jgi:hypothetical protein
VGAAHEDARQSTITNGTQTSADNSGDNADAIHVFRTSGSSWNPDACIKLGNSNDIWQGEGMALSLAADTLAVGVPCDGTERQTITNSSWVPPSSGKNSGAVFEFRRNNAGWSQEAQIKASNSLAMAF